MQNKSIAQLAADLRLRTYSSVELTASLPGAHRPPRPGLNSFITVASERRWQPRARRPCDRLR
jgi:aspartyl-tRNA(Asn)/glutamyl-tRNA(Gln) amidotransferase subunit A